MIDAYDYQMEKKQTRILDHAITLIITASDPEN